MKKLIVSLFSVASLLGACCGEKEESAETITVDVKNVKEMTEEMISGCQTIELRDSAVSLIPYIKNILPIENGYILNTDKVLVVDKNGTFLREISSKGQSEREYINMNDCWLQNDTLQIYDYFNKIISYNIDGTYIGAQKIATDRPFLNVISFADGFVGEESYEGTMRNALAFYDKDCQFVREIGELKIRSRISFSYPFSKYKDHLLYIPVLIHTIYSIDKDLNVKAQYEVDFLEHSIPKNKEFKTDSEMIDFANNSKENGTAMIVSPVKESDEAIVFLFTCGGDFYANKYDKKTGESTTYKVSQNIGKYKFSAVNLTDKQLVFLVEHEEGYAEIILFNL